MHSARRDNTNRRTFFVGFCFLFFRLFRFFVCFVFFFLISWYLVPGTRRYYQYSYRYCIIILFSPGSLKVLWIPTDFGCLKNAMRRKNKIRKKSLRAGDAARVDMMQMKEARAGLRLRITITGWLIFGVGECCSKFPIFCCFWLMCQTANPTQNKQGDPATIMQVNVKLMAVGRHAATHTSSIFIIIFGRTGLSDAEGEI